jgi:hypothetical protein
MKYHRGEPGVIYPTGGTYLDTADDDDVDAVVEFWRAKMEALGLIGAWSVGAVPSPVDRTAGGKWTIKIWEENE